ncbi:MAG: amidohydrolase, partial [Firmicutes bacterium]|nr:amidohydrolase [Bacillota bacterium]
MVGGKWPFELKPAFYEPERFLREQAEVGVTYTLVSPVPQLFLY